MSLSVLSVVWSTNYTIYSYRSAPKSKDFTYTRAVHFLEMSWINVIYVNAKLENNTFSVLHYVKIVTLH